jgi:hypothetical protein
MKLSVFWAFLFGLLASSASAIADSYIYDCSMLYMLDRKNGGSSVGFTVTYMMDTKGSQAYMLVNNQKIAVETHIGTNGIVIMEKTRTGSYQMTSISRSGDAVHTIHKMRDKGVDAVQYYGRCVARKS